MSDVISHAFQKINIFTDNNKLTSYFQNNFPLPPRLFGTEFALTPKWTQRVILCTVGELLKLYSLLRLPRIRKNIGRHGNTILPHGKSTLSSNTVNKSTSSLSSHLLLHRSCKATTSRAFKSRFQPSLKRYRSSSRPYTWLENTFPSKLRKITTSSPPSA